MWPIIANKTDNGERMYDLPSKLLEQRIILVTEEINNETSTSIIAQLLYLESIAPEKPITMYINSPGGMVTAGLAIYDTMNKVSCPITTVCIGIAASMGAFLLCSGSKGKRIALPNSCIMIHQPLGGAQGQATDIEISAKRILDLREKLYTIMAKNSNQEFDTIAKACERDNYLTPEQALDMGLIDEILVTKPKAYTEERNKNQ